MHQSIEHLKCVSEYYDYVFVLSEINALCLRLLGVKNVRAILSCYNPAIFYPVESEKKYDVSFLGQFDDRFNIVGSTRRQICSGLETDEKIKQFVGKGFYGEQANLIYNQSKIALDLPIMSLVGNRSFCVGATAATLMLPETKSVLWMDSFIPGEDYIEFSEAGTIGSTLSKWLDKPDERQRLRINMNKKLQEHTYAERFKEIISVVYNV